MSRTSSNQVHTRQPAPAKSNGSTLAANAEGVGENMLDKIEDFARANPISFGLYALGIGFILGWRLKPW